MKLRLNPAISVFIVYTLLSNGAFAMNPSDVDFEVPVAAIIERGEAALNGYSQGTALETGNEYSRLYFDIFEGSGMEFALGIEDSAAMIAIETGFGDLISFSMNGDDKATLDKEWVQQKSRLQSALEKHQSNVVSWWGSVLQSFFILLREGFEAMLVVMALVTYLRRGGAADKVHIVWQGVVYALIASGLTAWALHSLIAVSGAAREAIEGATMLLAAVLLFYVSYWLLAKSQADRWQSFIRGKVEGAISTGSVVTLGFAAFLAVYREGAETILFYQALLAGSGSQVDAVMVGFGLAAIALLVLYLVMRIATVRVPIGLFFSLTALFLFIMAFIFAGKGIFELQMAGLFVATPLAWAPSIASIGVFPRAEPLIVQALLLIAAIAAWVFMKVKTTDQVDEIRTHGAQ